ncbi:MAG: hypothetical protein KatS3mg131_0905 [Candidatus Tectimicrobiota bacterium]|nr:MAG: hypothetical protein KatS3mg131_0905 [Candidatus Tectomicrobia bacterium]
MLLAFFSARAERIVDALLARIYPTLAAAVPLEPQEVRAWIARGVAAFLDALRANDLAPLERFLASLVVSRTVTELPLAVLHRGFTAFGDLLLDLLRECYGTDTARLAEALQRLHGLKDALLTRLVAHYETQARDLFRRQQAQLQAYSRQLEAQLVRVGDEVQTLQEFNESILQSVTSGLLVADKETHRILKVNRAMERLTGRSAADLVGKTVEEVFGDVRGLPIAEFAEEVERQGTITLRKHRLQTADGREAYCYIKGQVFYNHKGENRGVIVLIDDISKRELLRETFSRYLSQPVLEQVLAGQHRPALAGNRRQLSVLFADLRHFTAFAEQHPPETVVAVLNQYLEAMVASVFQSQGTLDKFLGDGLLALFGAPLVQPDHAVRAVRAAFAMQQAVAELNKTRRAQGLPTLELGISINTGEAIVGNIGSEQRMEYTAVGDMVNVAQRLQALVSSGEVLVSDGTLQQVGQEVVVYRTLEARLRGRRQPVRVHHVGPRPPVPVCD